MKSLLHHAALNVCDIDWYVLFFQDVFGMEIRKTAGEPHNRKIWFSEGIQLNECETVPDTGGACDHISIAVPDVAETVSTALKLGCTPLPDGKHWFSLPNGLKMELMCMEE